MPEAGAIKMHFHALAMSVIGNGFYLILWYNGTVESILERNDLRWTSDAI
jgi:hypothetical protein